MASETVSALARGVEHVAPNGRRLHIAADPESHAVTLRTPDGAVYIGVWDLEALIERAKVAVDN